MNIKGSQTLDALAIAALPIHAQVSYLAAKVVKAKQVFALEQARELVRSLFPRHGELETMSVLLVEEANRQRPIANARRAITLAEELRNRPIYERLATPAMRAAAKIDYAIRNFGGFVKGSFSDDVLGMLALLKHENRRFELEWLDGGVRPAISAVVRVTVFEEAALHKRPFQKPLAVESFLLYKVPTTGEVKAAELPDKGIGSLRDAWAYQVPKEVLSLRKQGWTVVNDLEAQTLTATGSNGSVVFPWQGSSDASMANE